jgi:ATP-dependent Clp protease ATP-binding subunit ClpC
MEDGILSDNLGHKVSFKNTVIIMTSNVGARMITKGKSLGFAAVTENVEKDYKAMKDTVMDEVKRVFNPEFINRIDEVLVFHPLTEKEMGKILEMMLKRVVKKVESQNYKIEFTQAAKTALVEKGFDPNYGARPLQRTIMRLIEDPLAEDMLLRKFEHGSTILADYDKPGDKLVFTTKAAAHAE